MKTRCSDEARNPERGTGQNARRFAPYGSRLLRLLSLAIITSALAHADDVSSGFDQANKLYEQGKFAEAAASYERILQGGQASAALYFNLGNALFKSGQTGLAILNYRRAEQLAPRDPDIRANLQFARNSTMGGGAARPI